MWQSAGLLAAATVFSCSVVFTQPSQLPGRVASVDETAAIMGAACYSVDDGIAVVCSESCGYSTESPHDPDGAGKEYASSMCTNVSSCTAPILTGRRCNNDT